MKTQMARGLFMPQWGFDTDADDSFVTVPIDEAPDVVPVNVPRLPCGCPIDSGCDGYHSINE